MSQFIKKSKVIYKKMRETLYEQHLPPKKRYAKHLNSTENTGWKKKYATYSTTESVESDWVLYESHTGTGMVCNPLAIFKAFKNREDFSNYLHIWVIADEQELTNLRQEYASYENVIFVRYNSEGYAFFVAKSKYLINNTSFNPCFHKREEQIFLNTWHSITVKSLGYDTPDGPRVIKNMLRNMLMADYIISPNEFMTDIYDNSFRLRNIYNGKYIEEGYPRNDMVLNTNREEIFKKLEKRGTVIDRSKKIILYAPTWSGNNANNPTIDMSKYTDLYDHLSRYVDLNEYQILVKPHHVVYRRLSTAERKSGRYVSYTIDANELLSVVDILITDYSSIYFDFLMSKRPILFYIPDYEKYSKVRGIYFKLEELPGPCCTTLEDLTDKINQIENVKKEYKEIYDETVSWACKYDNGKVSEKILDIIFSNNKNYNIKGPVQNGKKSILMYIGNLATNGVTSAALSLLKEIDYAQYDVSVFVIDLKDADQNTNFDKIPSEVRVILRTSAPVLTKNDKAVYNDMLQNGIPEDKESLRKLKTIMHNEYVRMFGNASFDYVIDFSGYSPYFPALAFLGGQSYSGKRFMWQHSDMLLDCTNEFKKMLNKNKSSLEALTSCYGLVDKIVSAHKEVYKLNKRNLATPENKHKFTYVTNLMDKERIHDLLHNSKTEFHNDYLLYIKEEFPNGIKDITVFPMHSNAIKFVTMGRCMPEKNHANIIRAIKRLNDEGHNAILYIIGDGHLKNELESLAAELDIADKIFITGILQNPFALLKKCDCFVFPSIYEAQGLAVLEARTVGLPIIVSNYEAVNSVLIDDKQFVLDGTDSDSIYDGMMAYINGKIPCDYVFKMEEYNKQGFSEFTKLLS